MLTEFSHSIKGKVVLCGLRNGSIAPVDVRQKQHNQPTGVASSSNARRTVPILPTRHARKKRNQVCNASKQHPLLPYMSATWNQLIRLLKWLSRAQDRIGPRSICCTSLFYGLLCQRSDSQCRWSKFF